MLVPSPPDQWGEHPQCALPWKGEAVSGVRQSLRKSEEARNRGSVACQDLPESPT